jgi:hypothetical protein
MVDDILHLVDEDPLALEDSEVVIEVVMALGMEEVIHIAHDRGVEALTGSLGETAGKGEEVQVIVVILVEVPPLPVGEVGREVGALHQKGVGIGV